MPSNGVQCVQIPASSSEEEGCLRVQNITVCMYINLCVLPGLRYMIRGHPPLGDSRRATQLSALWSVNGTACSREIESEEVAHKERGQLKSKRCTKVQSQRNSTCFFG